MEFQRSIRSLSCAFIYVFFFSLSLVFALSFGLAFTEFVCAVPSVRVYYTCYTFSCIICTLGCECLYMFKLSIYCKCYPVMHSNCIVTWSILSPTHCCTFPTCMDSLRLTFLYIVCKHSIHIFVHFIYSQGTVCTLRMQIYFVILRGCFYSYFFQW